MRETWCDPYYIRHSMLLRLYIASDQSVAIGSFAARGSLGRSRTACIEKGPQ